MKWKKSHSNIKDTGISHSGSGESEEKTTKYRCAMGCEGDKTYSHPGNCPVCNMKLMPV